MELDFHLPFHTKVHSMLKCMQKLKISLMNLVLTQTSLQCTEIALSCIRFYTTVESNGPAGDSSESKGQCKKTFDSVIPECSLYSVLVASGEEVDEAMQVYALHVWPCDLALLLFIALLPFSLWSRQDPS